jgi:hypothetical protein
MRLTKGLPNVRPAIGIGTSCQCARLSVGPRKLGPPLSIDIEADDVPSALYEISCIATTWCQALRRKSCYFARLFSIDGITASRLNC